MNLSGFSSIIQLLGAFFFGFIGLKFLSEFYLKFIDRIKKEEDSINDQISTFSTDEIVEISQQLSQLKNIKDKMRLLYDQRFVELFLKGGIYSFFLLIYIGLESQHKLFCFCFLGTSLFFIFNQFFRIRFLLSNGTLVDAENIAAPEDLNKRYFDVKPPEFIRIYDFLFSSKIVYYNFKRDLKNRIIVFGIILLFIFHIPLMNHKYFIYLQGFLEINLLVFYSIVITIFSLVFPYILLFLTDTFTFYRVYFIRKIITDKISMHNENELLEFMNR